MLKLKTILGQTIICEDIHYKFNVKNRRRSLVRGHKIVPSTIITTPIDTDKIWIAHLK